MSSQQNIPIAHRREWVGRDGCLEELFLKFDAVYLCGSGALEITWRFGTVGGPGEHGVGATLHPDADGCPWEARRIADEQFAALYAECVAEADRLMGVRD